MEEISHFRVAVNLIIKARLNVKLLMESFALSLVYKMRFTATRKWPITMHVPAFDILFAILIDVCPLIFKHNFTAEINQLSETFGLIIV